MRHPYRRLFRLLLDAQRHGPATCLSAHPPDIYSVLPADLLDIDERIRRHEAAWKQSGAVRVTEMQVEGALQKARELQRAFDEAKSASRASFTLRRLQLVRLFVLTGLPRYGKATLLGGSIAVLSGLSVAGSPLVATTLGSALEGAMIVTGVGSCLLTAMVCWLWPTEQKRQRFHDLQGQRKRQQVRKASLQPAVEQAWAVHETLKAQERLCRRLDQARQDRQKVVALLSSVKYQLVHTDWRSLRGTDFEDFLSRVFQTLGYQVQLTKASADQGADLLVMGKGRRIAVQAKGYADSVGNHAVMEAVAGQMFYNCSTCTVITNSRFTASARRLAQSSGCRLIEGRQIPDLIEGRIY
jgi:hypothetical protein